VTVVTETLAHRTARTSALVLELYGGFIRGLGGWIGLAHVVELLGELGVDQATARAAVARLTRSGLLRRAAAGHDGGAMVGYELSDQASAILAAGDRRILQRRAPTDIRDGWVLVVFSIPERQRHIRHVLRSRLVRLGFGNTAPGVWIAPRWLLDDARGLVERLHLSQLVQVYVADYRGLDDVREVIARAWDLVELRALYARFIDDRAPGLARLRTLPRLEPRSAFVEYMRALSQWRRLPLLDPGLPAEFLPSDWEGDAAADLFFGLRELLEQPALQHVRAVTRS
jgi:phenylacetic acid degradation operon negative regulatory protein